MYAQYYKKLIYFIYGWLNAYKSIVWNLLKSKFTLTLLIALHLVRVFWYSYSMMTNKTLFIVCLLGNFSWIVILNSQYWFTFDCSIMCIDVWNAVAQQMCTMMAREMTFESIVTDGGKTCVETMDLCSLNCPLGCCQDKCAKAYAGGTAECKIGPIGTHTSCLCSHPCN